MFHLCMVTVQSPLLFLTKSHHQGSGLKTELWMLADTHLLPRLVNLSTVIKTMTATPLQGLWAAPGLVPDCTVIRVSFLARSFYRE